MTNIRGRISVIGTLLSTLVLMMLIQGCANMGSPQGGLYDEDPPKILYSIPSDKGVNVSSKKVQIFFNEYVKIENASEKVIVSPPQAEMPEIKDQGKKIVVELKDTLKPDITYTIDFSDAIVDFTEGNPLGNYTYSFSTGEVIDTFEVSGNVLDASNLEPVKGILVGVYDDLSDTVFTKKPLQRIARTDGAGHFVVRGIAPGKYRAYALKDVDGDYLFSQKGEMIAFSNDTITPSFGPAVRQDTTWIDSLHIKSIERVSYTRFTPDDLVLFAFTEEQTDRHLIKTERTDANKINLFFSCGSEQEPIFRGLNFDDQKGIIIESTEKKDTITYWLTDSALINNDSLEVELQYLETDTTGALVNKVDTITFVPKFSYEKRQKLEKEEYDKFLKAQKKSIKKGLAAEGDTIMPRKPFAPSFGRASRVAPDEILVFEMPEPVAKIDTAGIHLYVKVDTLWYRSPFVFRPKEGKMRQYEFFAEWRPDNEYSLEIDSAAFTNVYSQVSNAYKAGIKVGALDDYASLIVNLSGTKAKNVYVQLLNGSDAAVKTEKVINGTAEFYYVRPGEYYLRAFEDDNDNGIWDTGLFSESRQAERVYYHNRMVECKEKWDTSVSWNVNEVPVARQKPQKITKQKADKEKTIKSRNAEYILKYRSNKK